MYISEIKANLKRQVFQSFFIKALSVGVNLATIGILYRVLNKEQYGLWITLLSIASMFGFFDIGIGSGMRSKLTVAISENKIKYANELISTSYLILSTVVLVIILMLIIILTILNIKWYIIFNISVLTNYEYSIILFFLLLSVFTNFIFALTNNILHALQQSSLSTLIFLFGNMIFVLNIYFFQLFEGKLHLTFISFLYFISVFTAGFLVNFYVFKYYSFLKIRLEYFKVEYIKSLMSTSLKFFIIQITPIILNTTDSIIIAKLINAGEVAEYNTVFRYYNTIWTVFWLFISPLWAAVSNAIVMKEYSWLKENLKKYLYKLLPILFLCLIFFSYLLPHIIELWVGEKFDIDLMQMIFMSLFVLIAFWNNLFISYLNGFGDIKLNLYTSIFAMLINIPLSYIFIKHTNLGSTGVIAATVVCLIPYSILAPFRLNFLLSPQKLKSDVINNSNSYSE